MTEYNMMDIYQDPSKFEDLLFYPGYLIYKIRNDINNKCYIGDTRTHLYNRLFTGWNGGHYGCYESKHKSHLYNSMNHYGLSHFWITILPTKDYSEEDYIRIYDSYFNGYNQNLTGKGNGNCNQGMIWITNGSESKLIHPDKLKDGKYQEWVPGRLTNWLINSIWVNKDNVRIRINPSELPDYLNSGWIEGTGVVTHGNQNMLWVNDGVREWQLYPDSDLSNLNIGRLARLTKGLISITDGYHNKFIDPNDLVPEGWVIGSCNKSNSGYVYLNNGAEDICVHNELVPHYQSRGYVLGRRSSASLGRSWVVNSSGDRHVIKSDQFKYYKSIGYRLGRNWNNSYEIPD